MEYTAVLFIAGLCTNLIIAFLNGMLGYLNRSVWQGTLCAYYLFIMLLKLGLLIGSIGRKNSPVLLSMKSIGLVDAMVSILMLEIALIDTFGDITTEWARIMMDSSGSCVWLFAMAIGVFGIRWYIRRKL